MSWYRRTKLVFDSLRRNVNPNILSRSHVTYGINPTGSSKFSWFSSVSFRELGLQSLGRKTSRIAYNPFSYSSNRSYYVDRYQVRRGPRRWFQNPRTMILVGSGLLTSLYFGNLETVPYTKRTHLVLSPKAMEKLHGEDFENFKEKEKEKILPENHPQSIRVQMITKKVVDALQRDVRSDSQAHAADSHLKGINWEVLVVKKPMIRAFCMPAGKIVVYTGLLDKFKSDEEVATVIGHEVGHVVARHGAEKIMTRLYFAIPQLVLCTLYMPLVSVGLIGYIMFDLFLKLPLSRKLEKEADYIGLLLIASAGYDPRVAPKVYEKFREKNALEEFKSTHPSGKKRAQLLAQAYVMDEAVKIYREVQSRPNKMILRIFKFCR